MDNLERYLSRQKDQTKNGSGAMRRRLRDTAYERLKDAIRHASLEPGQPLSETQLSKLLGISRTPVREAIQQLVQEGLLQAIPGRAVTVAVSSIQSALNVIHVRSLVEPEVVRLVAESPTPALVNTLRGALTKMQQAAKQGDRATWSKVDTEWHEVLARACPNVLLGEMALQMRNRSHHVSVDTQTPTVRLVECTEEHRQVVEAIAAGDPDKAEQAMLSHIEALRQSMFKRLTRG